MKKIFIGLLCCLMLSGCGGSKSDKEEKDHSTTYRWSTSEVASKAPKLEKKHGRIENDGKSIFWVVIYDQNKKVYNSYVDKCYDAGFTKDISDDRDDEYLQHYAYTEDGYKIEVKYYKEDGSEDKNSLEISVQKINKDSSSDSNNQTDNTDSSTSSNTSNEVSADFKATMDEYEKFFDTYVDFMKSYDAKNSTSTQLAKYTELMNQYSKTMDAMNNVDENSLSDADRAYYVEVTGRITQKLAEVSKTMQ